MGTLSPVNRITPFNPSILRELGLIQEETGAKDGVTKVVEVKD